MITTLYVSTDGSDDWNGLAPTPNADRTDGPLATFDAARKRVWKMRDQNMTVGVVTVKVQAGIYHFANPLSFELRDKDIVFEADGGEVIVDGSLTIDGFEEKEVNGKTGWVASITHLLAGRDMPRSLFVDGERRPRSQYPKNGDQLVIEDVPDHKGDSGLFDAAASRFVVKEGDFDPNWRNPEQIEAVVNHLWIEERMPVKTYDPERRLISSTHRSIFSLKNNGWMGDTPCAKFIWENVFEAMTEPGEWYIDLSEELIYYLPKEGETIAETSIVVSLHKQLVRFHGDIDSGRKIEGIHFVGITFQHTDWLPSDGWGKWWDPETEPHTWKTRDSFSHFNRNNLDQEGLAKTSKIATVPQAAHDLPGVISFEAASNCSIRECTFRGLGLYAVDVRGGCSHLRIQGNTFTDIGGGGIKVDGAEPNGNRDFRTHRIYIGDNKMKHLGILFPPATGVLICHSDHNVVEHNEISHLYYTAISVGWVWGYDENPTQDNVIQYNYLHDIGQKRLSDMGAIYTLGNQPGTVIRGNHIHDVSGNHYGGWGIYLDEASSQITVEENLVYRTNSQSFHEHWGRGNVVRNNVFALSGTESVVLAREEHDNYIQYPKKGSLWMRNIFLTQGKGVFKDSMAYFDTDILDSDLNLFWDNETKGEPLYVDFDPWPMVPVEKKTIDLAAAKERGLERNSLVADPEFGDPENGIFTISDGSPAHKLGIKVLDTKRCGPRDIDNRIPQVDQSFRPSGEIMFAD